MTHNPVCHLPSGRIGGGPDYETLYKTRNNSIKTADTNRIAVK